MLLPLVACLLIAAIALGAWWLLRGRGDLAADSEATEIANTVRRYNELLSEGYRTLDMSGLREVASQLQAEDEYVHMASLAEGGVRLDPTLVSLELTRVSIEATAATAETLETWDYRHYSRTDGTLILEQKGLVYELAWDLVKQPDGRLLVSDIRAVSATSTVEPSVIGTVAPTMPGR